MVRKAKSIGALVLRLIVGLALLGCPGVGSAQGIWSVISLPQKPGEVTYPSAVAVDTAGSLYVADYAGNGQYRIQKRDTQGNWSVIATQGGFALAVDPAGNLYVADNRNGMRIQKRDAEGNWSVIATAGTAPGQVAITYRGSLAVDTAGDLYIADSGNRRIQKRDAQGNWSVIATSGDALGQVDLPTTLAVDAAGSLYVADYGNGGRIQKRDAQGNWSVLASEGTDPGRAISTGLAVDAVGNLYVLNDPYAPGRIQKRDAQGNWSVIASEGTALGQVTYPAALAVDAADNLYVADVTGRDPPNSRIQKRDAQGNWSVTAARGTAPGQLNHPESLAVDGAGNLYVADGYYDSYTGEANYRIQKRDAQGNWSLIASEGDALGQVYHPTALAADAAGNLYDVDLGHIQRRDPQGNWSEIDDGQIDHPRELSALAVDSAGNLYVAERMHWIRLFYIGVNQIQKRDAHGNWSVLASGGSGHANVPSALAVDTAGNLYVVDHYGDDHSSRIQRRDVQGNWSVIATGGTGLGQVYFPTALAVDAAGNLYVADGDPSYGSPRIQKRDAQGNWSVIATEGSALGQVGDPGGLAVDGAGNLYVADASNDWVLKYTPQP